MLTLSINCYISLFYTVAECYNSLLLKFSLRLVAIGSFTSINVPSQIIQLVGRSVGRLVGRSVGRRCKLHLFYDVFDRYWVVFFLSFEWGGGSKVTLNLILTFCLIFAHINYFCNY